jgi:hypothetical protein
MPALANNGEVPHEIITKKTFQKSYYIMLLERLGQ